MGVIGCQAQKPGIRIKQDWQGNIEVAGENQQVQPADPVWGTNQKPAALDTRKGEKQYENINSFAHNDRNAHISLHSVRSRCG